MMNTHHNYYRNTLRPYSTRPLSEAVTIDEDDLAHSPYPKSGRKSSLAKRRWAASMHAMYMVRLFESFLHNPFYSLVLSLRMFGLVINIDSKNSPQMYSTNEQKIGFWFKRILQYFLTVFMIIYVLYYAIRTTLTITSGGIWTNLKVLINAWITFWTVCLFLLRNNRIGSLMVQIQSVTAFLQDITPALKRKVMIAIGGFWIYLVISVVTFFLDFSYHSAEDIFAVNYGEWDVSPTVAGLIVYSDTILSVYFVRGTLVVIIITYILITHSIESLYEDLSQFAIAQNKNSRDLSLKGLRELKNRHQLLAHYMHEVDLIFSFMVFLWYILVVVSFCIKVNTVLSSEYSSANIEGWVSSIWSIGITLLIYIGVTLSSSFAHDESISSALNIERLANSHSIKSEGSYYFELVLFLTRINLNPIVLTCYRFFAIKKFLILMIALVVIAYYFFVVHYDLITVYIQQKPIISSSDSS